MSKDLKQCYLDGSLVDAGVIDPAKHKYLGMFRPAMVSWANSPLPANISFFCSTCGCEGVFFNHYKNGCYDIPQYISVNQGCDDAARREKGSDICKAFGKAAGEHIKELEDKYNCCAHCGQRLDAEKRLSTLHDFVDSLDARGEDE